MSRRLSTVLEHVRPRPQDTEQHLHLKQHLLIQSLEAQMDMSEHRLKEMALYLLHEMHRGLEPGNKSTLAMLPSYVAKRDPRESSGVVYALDLGGSNFRVIRMEVAHGSVKTRKAKKFQIPPKIISSGTHEQLFGFIADSILEGLGSFGCVDEKSQPLRLGFTFSFPTQQHSINSGSLMKWTKEFAVTGVVGSDVVKLLDVEFKKRGIHFRIAALCNDTVGTLVARFFTDPTTQLGVILGTGSNACYWEENRAIHKCGSAQALPPKGEMVVNMEFGNFDSYKMLVLPATHYDNELDEASENRGSQRLEKMISGKYLGEIARRILVDFSDKTVLPAEVKAKLAQPYSFESRFVGTAMADHHPGLPATQAMFKEAYGIDMAHEGHRRIVRTVCFLVSRRAAQLAGMAIAATLLKRNTQADATVAVDGSVFEKQPYFKQEMERAIALVLGSADGIRLQLTADGSGTGAGCIAALQK